MSIWHVFCGYRVFSTINDSCKINKRMLILNRKGMESPIETAVNKILI